MERVLTLWTVKSLCRFIWQLKMIANTLLLYWLNMEQISMPGTTKEDHHYLLQLTMVIMTLNDGRRKSNGMIWHCVIWFQISLLRNIWLKREPMSIFQTKWSYLPYTSLQNMITYKLLNFWLKMALMLMLSASLVGRHFINVLLLVIYEIITVTNAIWDWISTGSTACNIQIVIDQALYFI